MLRMAISLLIPGSIAVILRIAEVPYFGGEIIRSLCMASLSTSFVLIMGTYLRTLRCFARKRLAVVESLSWKRTRTA